MKPAPVLLLCLLLAGCALPGGPAAAGPGASGAASSAPDAPGDGLFAEITTPRGVITCELFYRQAPMTVASFTGLAEGTLGPAPRHPFFNGLTFHRVVPGFVIQGGDPLGTGAGGPGYEFPDEFFAGERHDGAGILSMANAGPDTNGSQFFITLGPERHLDFVHAIFGRVVAGADVPARIRAGDTMAVRIVRRGPGARAFRADDAAFAALRARARLHPADSLMDMTEDGSGPYQSGYLRHRLENLRRFTGRSIHVVMEEGFDPEHPGQTAEAYVDAQPGRLHLPPDAVLAWFFAREDRWYLAGARAGLTLPVTARPGGLPHGPVDGKTAGTAEASRLARIKAIYAEAEVVVSAIVDQTDPH